MNKNSSILIIFHLLIASVLTFSQISCTVEEDTIVISNPQPILVGDSMIIILNDTFNLSGNDTIIITNYDTVYCQFPNSILAGQDTGLGIHYVYLNDTIKDAYPPGNGIKELYLDVDANGSNDVTLRIELFSSPGSQGTYAKVEHWGNSEFIGSVAYPTWVEPLNFGDSINMASKWTVNSLLASRTSNLNGSTVNGLFINGQKNFIGVKILSATQIRYGWIAVTVINYGNKIVVHDYAITKFYCY